MATLAPEKCRHTSVTPMPNLGGESVYYCNICKKANLTKLEVNPISKYDEDCINPNLEQRKDR